jgi:dihydropteroate synthase
VAVPDTHVDSVCGPVPGLSASDRCLVMGIINVTPDSFSDGGLNRSVGAAVEHGLALAADGADIIDVGGESTRPGAERVPVEVELARTLPVVRGLVGEGMTVSIDTTRAVVARAAVESGAVVVNDVSGGLADPRMAACVATAGVTYIAMHWRAPSRTMYAHAVYDDVVADVARELRTRVVALTDAGIASDRIVLDPGLGFAKTANHDWQLLSRLDELVALGHPLLVGASRKSFLSDALGTGLRTSPLPAARDAATAAVSALAAAAGAFCVRVHDVASSYDAVRVAARWRVNAVRP